MKFFPFRRPQRGVSLNKQSACLVERSRRHLFPLGGDRIRVMREHSFPQGLLIPNHVEPNITDLSEFVKELKRLIGTTDSSSLALTLPDLCAQIELFDFDTLPKTIAEREALVKFRFQQNFQYSAGNHVVSFQTFRIPKDFSLQGAETNAQHRVLAASIRQDILEQYEQACDMAGFLPLSVGLSGFRLFNLFRKTMRTSADGFFTCTGADNFLFLAFRNSLPMFVRLKTKPSGPYSIRAEWAATLQLFFDSYPVQRNISEETPMLPLYFLHSQLDDLDPPDMSPLNHVGPPDVAIRPIPLTLEDIHISTKNVDRGMPSLLNLSAMAGVVSE